MACDTKPDLPFSLRAILGIAALAILLAWVVPLFASPSFTGLSAQAASCNSLSRQLVSVNRQISGGGKLKNRFSSARDRQRAQLRKAQAALNRLGCRKRRNIFKRSIHKNCSPLRKTIRRMKRNLARLGNTNTRSTRNAGLRRAKQKRSGIIRSMKRQGCGQYAKKKKPAVKKPRRSVKVKSNNSRKASLRVTPRASKRQSSGNQSLRNIDRSKTYRTMCVRKCDGFYFPVSYSTTLKSFISDAQSCNAMCPGAETELYYYKLSEGTPKDMVSARRGKAYTKLPTAFRYKRTFDKSCTCDYRQALEKAAEDKAEAAAAAKSKPKNFNEQLGEIGSSVLPVPRAHWGDDPETMITRVGGFDLGRLDELLSGNMNPSVSLRKRRVRVVGETFLPDQ